MDLHEYSTEDLKNELRRRKYSKNNAWYYYYEDEDEPDPEWQADFPAFLIVHRRQYHLAHTLQEIRITNLLTLPKGFLEQYQHGRFVYQTKRAAEKAEKKLQDFGFQKLSKPLFGEQARLYHSIGEIEFQWVVETRELKEKLEVFLLNHQWSDKPDINEYRKACQPFADSMNCTIHGYGHTTTFLPTDIFKELPNYEVG